MFSRKLLSSDESCQVLIFTAPLFVFFIGNFALIQLDSFFKIYETDKRKRVKENTWKSKSYVICTTILHYFELCKMEKIETKDIIAEQNELLSYQNEFGQPYSATHLIIIHGQLNSIFNHAVRFIAYSLIRRGSLSNGVRGI